MTEPPHNPYKNVEETAECVIDDGKIAEHILCAHCGYDLFGHDADGYCSECGRTVKLTLRFNHRKPSDQWLPSTLNACIVVIILLGLLLTAINSASSSQWTMARNVLSWMLVGWNLALTVYAIHRADRTAMLTWHATAIISITSIAITLTMLMLRIDY